MMRFILLCLISIAPAFSAAITSAGTGDWDSTTPNAPWPGGTVPGNGDTVTIRDGDVVTCASGSVCIAGTSGSSSTTAITIGQGGASTAKIIIATGGVLITRGNIVPNPQSSVRTSGYCALTVNGGGKLRFDAHLASSPSTTNYSWAPAANKYDAVLCMTGSANAGDATGVTTGGNHAVIDSDSSGGNGFIDATSNGPFEHSCSYGDLLRIGYDLVPAVKIIGTSAGNETSSWDHCTARDGGPIIVAGTSSPTSNISWKHLNWANTAPNSIYAYCFGWSGLATSNGSTVREITDNHCDASVSNPAGAGNWEGVTYENNMSATPTIIASAVRWKSFKDNLTLFTYQNNPGGQEYATQGDMSGIYMWYWGTWGHRHWFVPTSNATAAYDNIIFQTDVAVTNCNGNDILLTGGGASTTGVDFLLTRALVLPPAYRTCSPGNILQLLNANNGATISVEKSTVYAATESIALSDVAPVGYTMEVKTNKNNIWFVPPYYQLQFGNKTIDVSTSCILDMIGTADYNVGWGLLGIDPADITCGWPVTTNGTTTVTNNANHPSTGPLCPTAGPTETCHPFPSNWPSLANGRVKINGLLYTVVSVASDGRSLVVNSAVPTTGSYTMTSTDVWPVTTNGTTTVVNTSGIPFPADWPNRPQTVTISGTDYVVTSVASGGMSMTVRDTVSAGTFTMEANPAFRNQGKGYWTTSSTPSGQHDLPDQDPQFADSTRNGDTAYVGLFGHSNATAWSGGSSYAVGNLVSHHRSDYYNDATINFRCIKAYTAGATRSEPGAPITQSLIGLANWYDYWEPAAFQDIRDAIWAGTTYGGLKVIPALVKYVRDGFAPSNYAVCNGASDGAEMGAVPCAAAVKVAGPDTCQQGTTCTFSGSGGKPPYTYSLVSGSVGSINSSSGIYTAPSHIAPKQKVNGCQAFPNNSIFNTRIDGLPVHTNSGLWMSNINQGSGAGVGAGQAVKGSVVLSTDQATGMHFVYSPNPAIVIKSYKMLNGQGHSFNFYDAGYATGCTYTCPTGTGNKSLALSALDGAVGYLTDTVTGYNNPFSDGSAAYTVTGCTWSSGSSLTTCTTSVPHSIQVGDWISPLGITGTINPGGFSVAQAQAQAGTAGSTVTYNYASSDPGTGSGGTIQKDIAHAQQSINWVGWALDDQSGHVDASDTNGKVVFYSETAFALRTLRVFTGNPGSLFDIGIWATATVDFSNDGVTFVGPVTYTTSGAERADLTARYIDITINNELAYKYVRLRMTHTLNWIIISEVQFLGNETPQIFMPDNVAISQAGSAWTSPGLFAIYDNHYLTTIRNPATGTCKEQETYKHYRTGACIDIALGCNPLANSASGVSYDLNSLSVPGYATDAAGAPIISLVLHQDELLAAAAGDLDAVKHATRLTLDNSSINPSFFTWPAQAVASASCQGKDVVGHGTSTVTTLYPSTVSNPTYYLFHTDWPVGMHVTINGTDLTVVSVSADATSMVVSGGTVPAGNYIMTMPLSNCPTYGTHIRLKSSFNFPHQYVSSISGNTVTASIGDPFPINWDAGHAPTVEIDGTNYNVTSGNGLTIVVSGSPPSGAGHVVIGPVTASGAGYYASGATVCTTACKNVIQAIVRAQKRYGLFITDVGTSWAGDGEGNYNSYDIFQAFYNMGCRYTDCLFDGLVGSSTNYEIVDSSGLQTSKDQTTTDPKWMEAKLDNSYGITPEDAVVVQVTDAVAATARLSVSLQGVAVGVERANEIVKAGAAAFQLNPWVTGSPNTAFTCSLSPTGGVYGTITSGCLYAPPASASANTLRETTVTVTAAADGAATQTTTIHIIDSSDGKIRISGGKANAPGSPYYTEPVSGAIWWNDMAQERATPLFPNEGTHFTGLNTGNLVDYSGTNYVTSAPGIFTGALLGDFNDHHMRIHLPNGVVSGTALHVSDALSTAVDAFSFDCNGTIVVANMDAYTWQGAQHVVRPLTCTKTVVDGVFDMVVRPQGHGPYAPNSGTYGIFDTAWCGYPCYVPGRDNFVAGFVVSTNVSVPPAGGVISSGWIFSGGSVVR